MKKILMIAAIMIGTFSVAFAQKPAEIKFEKLSHNFGTFTEAESIQKCTFSFTNIGEQPLVINQAVASCGCTVPEYTKTPIHIMVRASSPDISRRLSQYVRMVLLR